VQIGQNGEETPKTPLEMTRENIKPMVLKDMAPTIIQGLFNGLYELDESSRAIVLRKAGAACAQAVRAHREKMGMEYPTGVDLDTACGFYTRVALQGLKRDFTCEKDGEDTVEIRDAIGDLFGSCSCQLVLADLIEPNDSLCRFCQEGFWIDNFEYMTGRRPEKSEFPESRTMGHRECVVRCHFKPME